MAFSQDLFDCSICLQLLVDPVTTTCGHSFCMKCINAFWDRNNNQRRPYSCPQCRQTFCQRPALKKNTLLASLVEEHKATSSESAAGDACASPGDVLCDACMGKKRKASMFCLVCLASFCEAHLKPHFEVPPLRKHNLIQASARITDNICGRHEKLVEIFCRTDQQFICLTCLMEEHKGHDTIAVAAEKCQMQKQLEKTEADIAEKVLNSERKMAGLSQAADCLRNAAWETCDDFEHLCTEHIHLYVRSMERKCSEMRAKVAEVEKAGVDWTDAHFKQLKREVLELRTREDKLKQLSQTEDPIQFLQAFRAFCDLPVFTNSPNSLDMLPDFVTEQKDKLADLSNKKKKELFRDSEEHVFAKMPRLHMEVISRKGLLAKYKNSALKLDPNTVSSFLTLSGRNRELSWGATDQAHPDHPDRFTFFNQALCKTGLQESHYWEVEWDGGVVELAVSYKGIERKGLGNGCCFGHNSLSWKLTCSSSGCRFWHNNLHKGQIPPVHSRKVGVHLKYKDGTLDFYSVSASFTLLHHVQTSFTEPLYPGFSVDLGSTLKICNI